MPGDARVPNTVFVPRHFDTVSQNDPIYILYLKSKCNGLALSTGGAEVPGTLFG
jgi:hypothetical protein